MRASIWVAWIFLMVALLFQSGTILILSRSNRGLRDSLETCATMIGRHKRPAPDRDPAEAAKP